MIRLVKVDKEFIFANKPANLTTHTDDVSRKGFVEHLERRLGQKLYVVHRLDKTTSGAMVFATTSESAASIAKAFHDRKISKRYLLVTDRVSKEDEFWAFSKIEKQGSHNLNTPSTEAEANAVTHFRRVKRSPFFELWEAFPKTGRTHQIRLHAQQLGLSILGDTLYGGKKFPHLCLHAESLQLPDGEKFSTPPPRFFERLGFLKDEELCVILSAIDRRLRWFSFFESPEQCLRLLHDESPDYRLDLLGQRMWLYWYKDSDPTPVDLCRWSFLSKHIGKPLLIRKMKNRGIDPKMSATWKIGELEGTWTAMENQLRFEFRQDQGLSPGLFLDQRENRLRVFELAKDKSVLNLFAYTCGFSVAAAKGGAREVASVDVSGAFLDWGRKNFSLNELDPEKFEFFTADSFFFLERALKKSRKFDVIILDPPSFSRAKDLVFSLEKDFARLLSAVEKVLAPAGQILVSSNFESWSFTEMQRRIQKALPGFKISPAAQGFDYERDHEAALMKAFWVTRR